MTTTSTGKIYDAIPKIMADIPAIGKDRKNVQQGYQFRGIDDVYNVAQPIFAKHGVFMRAEILDVQQEERQSRSGGTLIYTRIKTRYYFTASDGSSIYTDVLGEGMDSGDKAANKAMSVGQKYAILQVFCIPTDDMKDPECESPEPAPKPAAPKPPAASKPKTAPTDPDYELTNEGAPLSPYYKLDDFKKAKEILGAEAYYLTLAKFKAEHANDIKPEARDMVLSVMRDLVKQKKGAAK